MIEHYISVISKSKDKKAKTQIKIQKYIIFYMWILFLIFNILY